MEPLVEFGDEVERVSGASLGDRGSSTGMAEVEKNADLRTKNGQLRPTRRDFLSTRDPTEVTEPSKRTPRDVQRTGNLRETPT